MGDEESQAFATHTKNGKRNFGKFHRRNLGRRPTPQEKGMSKIQCFFATSLANTKVSALK